MEEHYARLQDRGDHDDPELGPAFDRAMERGHPGSVLSPVLIEPVTVVGSGPAAAPPKEQVKAVVNKLKDKLLEEAKKENPDFYKNDNIPAPDPSLQWMRDWRPDRGEK